MAVTVHDQKRPSSHNHQHRKMVMAKKMTVADLQGPEAEQEKNTDVHYLLCQGFQDTLATLNHNMTGAKHGTYSPDVVTQWHREMKAF